MADEHIFQVSEFNEFINTYLRQVNEIVVEGEITEVNISQSKWLFITLKDAQSSLNVFAVAYQISAWRDLEPGMKVHVYGTPGLHQKSGKFSFNANRIVPAGEGALRLAFEKLKLRLESEGLFDISRKRALPLFPLRLGLITAADGEAYSDFIKVLRARMGGIKIFFYPVSVQGRDSVSSIIKAFRYFNKLNNIDLLVLTRGGGSLEDLQSFNDEQVVRAIFSSRIPVVSGVGHERDVSLADLAADVRASTPSNAAELISRSRMDVLNQVNYAVSTMDKTLHSLTAAANYRIFRHIDSLKRYVSAPITANQNLLARFRRQLDRASLEHVRLTNNLSFTSKLLIKNTFTWFRNHDQNLLHLTHLLTILDYHQVLRRGYTITSDAQGKIIRSVSSLTLGSPIITTLADGKITSTLQSLSHDQN